MPVTDVAVVGGGITGLVAARELSLAGARVTLVEPGRLGGKVQSSTFDGGALDEAADAFLARVPEGIALCRDLGLGGDLVSPAVRRAYVFARRELRLLPEAQLLGVPTDLDELAASGIVSAKGLERARRDLSTPLVAPADDPTIGAFIRDRLGDQVAERLVDPLVGGINAGDTDHLSLAATVPQLDAAARSGAASLIEACQAQRAAVSDPGAPVFFAPRGGMGALVQALVADLRARGVTVVGDRVDTLERRSAAWSIGLASGAVLPADGVVLAVPAGPAAALLHPHSVKAAALLGAVPYASVAMVALAVPSSAIDRDLDGSGFLVPRAAGRTVTACSWASSKWPHLHGRGTVWLRASVGRDGDDTALGLADRDLVAAVARDLGEMMALRGPVQEARVTRWTTSFPQYRPGHLTRIDALDAELTSLTPTLAVAGAALRGLGVPACIRQGATAARRVLATLGGPS